MQCAPFLVPGFNQQSTSMGMNFHLIPDMHVLFFGPAECARHTYPGLVDDPKASMLVIDDVQTSLGKSEDLIREAVDEIVHMRPEVRGFVLCTACQTAFLGIDLEGLCTSLHQETGLAFSHIEANRMSADNIPGRERKTVPGGDRYHTRRAFMRMLAQVPREDDAPRGILVLSDEPLDASNELLVYAQVPGISWVKSVGDCESMDEFLELRHAISTIALAPAWAEPQKCIEERLGIPGIFASTSYSLSEIDGYYASLDAMLMDCGLKVRELEVAKKRIAGARRRAVHVVDELLSTFKDTPLELDLRVVGRPFSLVETLLDYGFRVIDMQPSYESIQHKEADDAPAFERLCEREPGLALRFAKHGNSQTRSGGTTTRNARRTGRFVVRPALIEAEHVPEEVSWWGYASIVKLAQELGNARLFNGEARSANIWADSSQSPYGKRLASARAPRAQRTAPLQGFPNPDTADAPCYPERSAQRGVEGSPATDEGKWDL